MLTIFPAIAVVSYRRIVLCMLAFSVKGRKSIAIVIRVGDQDTSADHQC